MFHIAEQNTFSWLQGSLYTCFSRTLLILSLKAAGSMCSATSNSRKLTWTTPLWEYLRTNYISYFSWSSVTENCLLFFNDFFFNHSSQAFKHFILDCFTRVVSIFSLLFKSFFFFFVLCPYKHCIYMAFRSRMRTETTVFHSCLFPITIALEWKQSPEHQGGKNANKLNSKPSLSTARTPTVDWKLLLAPPWKLLGKLSRVGCAGPSHQDLDMSRRGKIQTETQLN